MLRRLLLAAFALCLFAGVVAAQKSLVIESFDAEVTVLENGSVVVTETIRPRFTGQWNGIYRDIPIEYRTQQGLNYTLQLDLDEVTDENGNELKVETSRVRHYRRFKIWVPGAYNATRTVRIRYRVPNALRFFEDHDELYWNVTGDEWEIPIEHASADIMLPSNTTGIRVLAFTGQYGSKEHDATVETEGSSIRIVMNRPLSFKEGLTAVVGWDKGFVKEPTALDKTWRFFYSNWPLVIPFVVLFMMYHLWHTRGRDPELRPISPQYEPPPQMTPGEVGTLADNTVDMRDITATLVDLAVRGFLTIEEKEESKFLGLMKDKEYVFHLQIARQDWRGIKAHERQLLEALFSGGHTGEKVELEDLENKFYKSIPGIKDRIYEALLMNKFYLARPDKVKRNYVIGGIIVGGLMVWGGGFLSAALSIAPLAFILAGILSGLIIVVFGLVMPARTAEGARALEKVRGFEEFLGRVEADRMERTIRTPQMFEKFLPFAMALGVDKQWSRAFEGICTEPPSWYRGYGYGPQFFPTHFTNDLNRMSARAGTVMVSAPRSSGGSGFSGGGGSGGGFGGGGGGGF